MSGSTSEGGEGGTRSAGCADDVRQAFASLSFDQKISTLIQVELDMLGDAVGSVVSAVSKAVDDLARACEGSESSASASPGAGREASNS